MHMLYVKNHPLKYPRARVLESSNLPTVISEEYKTSSVETESILTWYRGYRDHAGGASRKRPFHCTSVGLKPAITPNVGNSGTQFLCVGVCVRANPCP